MKDFWSEIDDAIHSGVAAFEAFISRKCVDDSAFLEQFFWQADASQKTVLNHLIAHYVEPPIEMTEDTVYLDLWPLIEHVLTLSKNKNLGEPLHQAIDEEKTTLVLHLLHCAQKHNIFFDMTRRDCQGRSLIGLALAKKNTDILKALLQAGAQVAMDSRINGHKAPIQPLHQAILLDDAASIRQLIAYGAQLTNPYGALQDTPLFLAIRFNAIHALPVLLEQPQIQELLNEAHPALAARGATALNAIEFLCRSLQKGAPKEKTLSGIAMLLCRGAEPPRQESMRHLLSSHRIELLRAMSTYLDDKPELVDPLVQRCHRPESALHNILYANYSFANSVRHFFGNPSDAALMVEQFVVRKYTAETVHMAEGLPTAAAANVAMDTDPLKLYALFVKRYQEAYGAQLFANPWSTMRWMIADGRANWETVTSYVETNPKSRSAIIYNELFQEEQKPVLQEDSERPISLDVPGN